MADYLLPNHFLSLPRPDAHIGSPEGVPDTSTLAAADFDVDNRTGFMPPQPPLTRLPSEWETWEEVLEDAVEKRIKLGSRDDLTDKDKEISEGWRETVRKMPVLSTDGLFKSEFLLRRAHHVLSYMMHFYIHSQPPTCSEIHIPRSLTLPLLRVSAQLQLPPVVTYSDDVLYNWRYKEPATLDDPYRIPTIDNIKCDNTLFTGTNDEQEFYLASARVELRGVEALELMRLTMDEAFVGDAIAFRRITAYLHAMAEVIRGMTQQLLRVREGCDPAVFYNEIRPWFKGADSGQKKWIFDGLDEDPTLLDPEELSGPSAGQSSMIHALDVFFGVDQYSHSLTLSGSFSSTSAESNATYHPPNKKSFLDRMQIYMPRYHRAFLRHLAANPRPLRSLVSAHAEDAPELLGAYNAAVTALKEFRDAHMRIVAVYIIGPSRKVPTAKVAEKDEEKEILKGTGGTDLVKFLKGVRDRTASAVMPAEKR
ncbi:Indoleamine 2,3-dioxygenase [Gloeophyllum trabeum ATCC 11539]|uniref:Indoleamine 2,3-dioxygenase n=1 Tax=Gloeophyllum trabeum (strain ATCC 11539 / FP-39264 / Madison 617) TaxID=670483 RepID=S7PXX6_GLOTA|nr:Indoleamine 2,3-dioxygenase [Gloeophyllum trabeum ATCC 11539]EPQ52471.1 Indoleamine 2,3-dioxygenase [Gloeophyllum trabeum ATCC 11539]